MILTYENQSFSLKTLNIQYLFDDILNLKETPQKLLNVLLQQNFFFNRLGKKHFESQSTLAGYIGRSREWTNKLLAQLKELGYITWTQIEKDDTCIYEINPIFYRPEVQQRLSAFFSNIMYKFTAIQSGIKKQFTLFRKRNYIFNSYCIDRELLSTKKVSLTTKKIVSEAPRTFTKGFKKIGDIMGFIKTSPQPEKNTEREYDNYSYNRKDQQVQQQKPPSHKVWQAEYREFENVFTAAQNLDQAMTLSNELGVSTKNFNTFAKELQAAMNMRLLSIAEENEQEILKKYRGE